MFQADVRVVDEHGQVTVLTGAFQVMPPPVATGISPTSGPQSGGTTVVISGSGFRPSDRVFFGTAEATGVSVNADGTEITCVTPPMP